MGQGGIEAFGAAEGREGGHLHKIRMDGIEGAVALFEVGDDLAGDTGINVGFRAHGLASSVGLQGACAAQAPLPVGETGGCKGKKNHGRFAAENRKVQPQRSGG